ncbi:MAG: hypothetical protein ACHRHE_07580 [Tepidisphaerales bacterium]
MNRFITLSLIALVGASSCFAADIGGEKNRKADTKAIFVHRIGLKDEAGMDINPKALAAKKPDPKGRDAGAPPYSPTQTCATCHPTVFISHGWHFNAMEKPVKPGRNGEPWIYVDASTRTVLPLSYRDWAGAFKPAQAGLTDWDMAQIFGRHMPGGSFGTPPQSEVRAPATTQPAAKPSVPAAERWQYTGRIEVDCLLCHSSENRHDATERGIEIMRMQNFRWAPTVAMGFGRVTNSAASLGKAGEEEDEDAKPPRLTYNPEVFDAEGKVNFDLVRRPPNNRCYFCHTSFSQADGDPKNVLPRWTHDGDIHMAKGLNCSDCHRHGIEHDVTRGFIGEDPAKSSLTCQGCHMGNAGATTPQLALGGHLAAPVPHHVGLPPVHLDKIACTTCHSGPWPGDTPQLVQTAMAHQLGMDNPNRMPNSLPRIVWPVFLKGADGKLAPHKMVWPNYFGLSDGKSVAVIPPKQVIAAGKTAKAGLPVIEDLESRKGGYLTQTASAPLTDEQVIRILAQLKADKKPAEPVYVSGGDVYSLGADGKLAKSAALAAAAKPYAWPIAHDVRGAGLSLGARGCTDCHSKDSPVFFASVTPVGPIKPGSATAVKMADLAGLDATYHQMFALSFLGRTAFKTLILVCAGLVALVIFAWFARGVVFRGGCGCCCKDGCCSDGDRPAGGACRDGSTCECKH